MNEALLLQWKQFCGIFTFLHKEALAILDHKSRTRTKVNKENWPSLASTLVKIVFLKFDNLEASKLDCNLAILIISFILHVTVRVNSARNVDYCCSCFKLIWILEQLCTDRKQIYEINSTFSISCFLTLFLSHS